MTSALGGVENGDAKHMLAGWPCWNNKYSNTVFFKRPDDEIVSKYNLANSYDERFGGNLSHVVVMQHVKKEVIDKFISELEGIMTSTAQVKADATRTDSPEHSLSGTKVASDMKPGVVVTTGKKRIVK